MSLTQKIAYNSITQFLGKVITTITSLGIVALVTRSLGVAGYGDYTAIVAYCQLAAVFAELGINVHLIKRLTDPQAESEKETAALLGLRLMSSVVILLAAYLLSFLLPYSPLLRSGIAIVLFSIFAQTLNSLFVSIFQARMEIKYAVFSEVIGRLFVLLVTAVMVFTNQGLLAVISAVTVGSLINVVISYLFARRFIPLIPRFGWAESKKLLKVTLPISISAILAYIYFKVDTVLLSVLPLEGGRENAVEVGIYGSAYKVLDLLILIPAIFLGSFFPVLTGLIANKSDRLLIAYQKAFDVLAALGLPITAMLFMLADRIIPFIAGAEFAAAALPLRILSFAILLTYFSGLFNYTALALSRQKEMSFLYVGATIFNIGLNIWLIPHYSYLAAAYVTLATEVVVLIGSYFICQRDLQARFSLLNLWKTVAVSGVLLAVLWGLKDQGLLLNLLITVPLYLALLVLANVLTKEQIQELLNRG